MAKQKVYISSTFKDLKDYRTLVKSLFENQLAVAFELCKIMERMWDDGSQTPFVAECVREVKAADIYIIILGNKVGSFPPNETRTYTEIELDTALADKNKKIFCFPFKDFDAADMDNAPKHAELLKKFEGKPTHPFANPTELRADLLECLLPLMGATPVHQTTKLSLNNPEDPKGFLGREDELRTIYDKLHRGGRLMLINAEGGIGKTTLAAKYWNQALNRYKHAAWLFCEGGIINTLKELAPQLNVDLSGLDEAGQLAALKRSLHAVQNEFLLVLDNANDEGEIKVFREEFEGFHWHVLITSRCQGVLDAEQELPITHLPPPLAKALFVRYYTEDSPEFETLLDKVLQAIQYHTLLTEVFAKNLAEAAELGELNLRTFLDKLEKEGLHLKGHSFEIGNNDWATKRKAATTDDILDALYDFGKLSPDQHFLMVNLALLPAEPYTLTFINDLLADENTRPARQLRDTLKGLVKKGWIGHTERTYRLSPVVQKLVLEKQTHLGQDAQVLLDRLNYILDADAYNLLNISLQKAPPYVQLVPHLYRCLEVYPSIELAHLTFYTGIYFENVGDIVAAQKTYQTYQAIYQQLLNTDPENLSYKNGLAISYEKLGGIYEARGDWKNALLNYEEYNRLEKEIYESSPENLSYKNGLAISYSKLGGIYQATGDWKNALLNYEEDFRITKEIYESSPENLSYKNGLAISYSKLGGIYQATGDWKNALLNYEEQLRIFKEIYESSPENLSYKNGLAISYSKLGGIYEATGDWKNALLNYEEQLRIFKEIYESSPENLSYKNGLAISYSKLGGIYEATGDWKNALLNYEEQLRIFKEIYESSPENLSYKNGLAISYSKLGGIYQATGDWKNALLNYEEDFRITKEIYESSPENLSYKNGLAISYLNLAGVFMAEEQISDAVRNYDLCRKMFLEIVQATQGQLIDFVYNYAWTCNKLTQIVKQNALFDVIDKDQLKSIRREGYQYIQPIYEAGLLRSDRVGVAEDLADEGWYEF